MDGNQYKTKVNIHNNKRKLKITFLQWAQLLQLLRLVGADLKTGAESSLFHKYKNKKAIVYKNVKNDGMKADLLSTFSLSWCSQVRQRERCQ